MKKFSGWKQLVFVAIITGMTAQYGSAAVSLSNTIMRSGAQVAMTATAFGLGSTLYSLMQGPPQLVIGAWIKKQGTRRVFLLGIPFMVLVTLGLSNLLNTDISYILVYGIMWGLAYMLMSQIAMQSLINNWFIQRRGFAMNVMLAITCIFSFISPYVVNAVIGAAGNNFKAGWYSIGVMSLICYPLVFWLKDKPEDVGEYPDGVKPGTVIQSKDSTAVSTVYKVSDDMNTVTVKEALKNPKFISVLALSGLGFAVSMVAFSVASVHFVNEGFDLSTVSGAMAWRNFARLAFLLIIAKISDRIEPGFLFGIAAAACGIFTLLSANAGNMGIALVYVYFSVAMIFGACLNTIIPTMIANIFGRNIFPALQGIVLTVGGLVSATTGTIGGLIADADGGSYSQVFIIYAVVCFVMAAIAVLGVGIPCSKKYRETKTTK